MHGMEDSDWNPNITGFATGVNVKAEEFGTVMLAVKDGNIFLIVSRMSFTYQAPDVTCFHQVLQSTKAST